MSFRRFLRLPRDARRIARDVDDELAFHLEMRTAELVAAGVPRAQAQARAWHEFGDVERARRLLRTADGSTARMSRRRDLVAEVAQDARYALRQARRSPVVALAALLTIAIGMSGTAAAYAVLDGTLLRPLPFADPGALVRVWGTNGGTGNLRAHLSLPNLADFVRESRSFAGIAAYRADLRTVTGGDETMRVEAGVVTDGFFQLLGIAARDGRVLVPADFSGAAGRVVVISNSLRARRFGTTPDVVGRTLLIDDVPYTVAGVLPPSRFALPSPNAEMWIALPPETERGSRSLAGVARLKPGIASAAAERELATIARRLELAYPESNAKIGVRLESLRASISGDARSLLVLLFCTASAVLLIAAGNVANLLLARSAARRREIAVRVALGAGRGRLVRQMLTESALLTLAGGALGLLAARPLVAAVAGVDALALPRRGELAIDGRVMVFAFAVSLVVGLLAGLAPALSATRRDLSVALKRGASGVAHERGRLRAGSVFVMMQIALSVVLVIVAGLLTRSFVRLAGIDPGFRSEQVLTFRLDAPRARYPSRDRVAELRERIGARLGATEGIADVGAVNALPLGGGDLCVDMAVGGRASTRQGTDPCVKARMITGAYLRALGVPLRRGRLLDVSDGPTAPPVGLVSASMAQTIWPGIDPIGRTFEHEGVMRVVVGVVGDVRHEGLDAREAPTFYVSLAQFPQRGATWVARVRGDVPSAQRAVREAVRAVDPALYIGEVQALSDVVRSSVARPRLRSFALGGFAIVALVLAVVGIAGVAAFHVTRRTAEIGIRLALGASQGGVVRHVVMSEMRFAVAGLVIGMLGAVVVARLLGSTLFEVAPLDPLVFAVAPVVLFAATLIACWLPSRRAARVDPLTALRLDG